MLMTIRIPLQASAKRASPSARRKCFERYICFGLCQHLSALVSLHTTIPLCIGGGTRPLPKCSLKLRSRRLNIPDELPSDRDHFVTIHHRCPSTFSEEPSEDIED